MMAKPEAIALAGKSTSIRLGDRYLDTLHGQISGSHGEGKSSRTRAKLLRAAFECLSENELSALTIAAVTGRAKVAAGTFYIHFESTSELALEVFAGFLAEDIVPAIPQRHHVGDPFLQMKAIFYDIVGAFRRRRKFFRSLFQLKRQNEQANLIWLKFSTGWAEALSCVAHCEGSIPVGFDRFIGHAASAFADEIMTRIYIDEIFGPVFPEDPANDDEVAELLAFTRHRMLYGIDPSAESMKRGQRSNGCQAVIDLQQFETKKPQRKK